MTQFSSMGTLLTAAPAITNATAIAAGWTMLWLWGPMGQLSHGITVKYAPGFDKRDRNRNG